jgi:hypothetical protein
VAPFNAEGASTLGDVGLPGSLELAQFTLLAAKTMTDARITNLCMTLLLNNSTPKQFDSAIWKEHRHTGKERSAFMATKSALDYI